jgi:hypothetical protein
LNDLDGFTAAVQALVSDAAKRSAISQQSKVDVERLFIENCAKQYEALFREVIDDTEGSCDGGPSIRRSGSYNHRGRRAQ